MPVPVVSLCTSRRPRMSQRAQAVEVDLGVDFCCVGNRCRRTSPISPMVAPACSMEVARLCRSRWAPLSLGCKFARPSALRTIIADRRRLSKPSVWRPHANEHPARLARRPVSTQIGGQGLAYIRRQGHPVVKQSLASNEDFASSPVDVLELESDHFSSAKTEAG